MINSILISWHSLVIYLNKSKETEAKGHYNFLTDKSNLLLLAFMADVLEVYSRFQKNLQKDSTTILDMMEQVHCVCLKLKSLAEKNLLGGWTEALQNQLQVQNDQCTLKGIYLSDKQRRTNAHHLYVSVRRDVHAVKNEIINSLINFTEKRFEEDEKLVRLLKDFVKFDKTVNLKEVHESIASDLDLTALDLEFSEIIHLNLPNSLKNMTLTEIIKKLDLLEGYPTVTKIFARIAAAKPHSADVERLISCNNILKSASRSSFSIETENLYMYIYFNMPPLESWDPRPAVDSWIKLKDRRNKSHEKAEEQTWYTGIFQKANKRINNQKNNSDENNERPQKKRKF